MSREAGVGLVQLGPMSGGGMYIQVQSIMVNGHLRFPSPCEHTNTIENITFLQLCWRAAKIIILHYASFYCLFGTRRLNRIVHT